MDYLTVKKLKMVESAPDYKLRWDEGGFSILRSFWVLWAMSVLQSLKKKKVGKCGLKIDFEDYWKI